jgi:hypothetical protein
MNPVSVMEVRGWLDRSDSTGLLTAPSAVWFSVQTVHITVIPTYLKPLATRVSKKARRRR